MRSHFQTFSTVLDAHMAGIRYAQKPYNLYEPITHILDLKGKRIRPLLSLMTYHLLGKKIDEQILNAATAIEFFHNFTLIHDDIIDNSSYRRGELTVHKKFGINAGILSGDALMILAYQQLDKLPAAYFPLVLKTFNSIAMGICEGQQLDINFETQDDVSLDEYFKMIELKTSILLGLSFQIAGLLAGVSEKEQQLLFEVGKNLGIAYQIQDDYLDTFGDFEKFGKPIGNDIILNKKTYLSIVAKQQADEKNRQKLNQLQVEQHTEKKIRATTQLFHELQIPQQTKTCINAYVQLLETALQELSCLEQTAKQQILNLVFALIERND